MPPITTFAGAGLYSGTAAGYLKPMQTTGSPIVFHLDEAAQRALLDDIAAVLEAAPFYRPVLPRWGTPFSVRMSNCGPLGWVSDKKGYRYQRTHPTTGRPWPDMPRRLLDLWHDLAGYPEPPQACLINHYTPSARMGLHQDRDEEDFDAPVLSVSLGDAARFRLGGQKRTDPVRNFELVSGDVMMLRGPTRLAFHGVDRIYSGTSGLLSGHGDLLEGGGRLNLTLRRVTNAQR